MFRAIVVASMLAGLIAGLFTTLAHHVFTVPLILQSEAYEQASPAAPNAASHTHVENQSADQGDVATSGGIRRGLLTALADIFTMIGFALILTSAYAFTQRGGGWREGLIWGLAGFCVVTLAPGLGLPPELPGIPAADLKARQIWWIATAFATAAGLGLLVFQRAAWAAALALAFIAAPHVIGAPLPADAATQVPYALWRSFIAAVTVTSLLSWALLGALTGAFYHRFLVTWN